MRHVLGEEMQYESNGPSGRIPRRMFRLQAAEWCVAVFVTGVAILLHLHFLRHANALWRDEINSINLASMPALSQVWHLTEFDSFPVLWTVILRAWIHGGFGS